MNNIFNYATKELSQDAFLCWSINWLSEDNGHPMYQYGKAMLDLFLGSKKQELYKDVVVRTQYERIDVLVLFKDGNDNSHVLIIEDKTNTSEHGNQMQRYKEKVCQKLSVDTMLKKYSDAELHLAYIKTGIMYDKDVLMVGKGAVVVDLDALLYVVSQYEELNSSEILSSFYSHIQEIKDYRVTIESQIENGDYETALQDSYGQFLFMDKLFVDRKKNEVLGNYYVEHENNYPICIDNVYAGTNNGGRPWIQYCFWGGKYPKNHINPNINEYHYLFWRIDCNWRKEKSKAEYYIALRHYDEHAHSKDDYLDERKRVVYRKMRKIADDEYENNTSLYTKIGKRENYKESDLLFIPIEKLQYKSLDEIKELLTGITNKFKAQNESLYIGI